MDTPQVEAQTYCTNYIGSIMKEKIAIVILNWNGKHHLATYLPSVLAHSSYPNVEIVVIDNASTDNSIEFLRADYPTVSIIPLPENYGFTGGYNRGIKEITADYAVFLNSDVEVTPNWLNKPIEHLQNNPNTVAVQPKIMSVTDKATFEFAGASGGYIDFLGFPFCRGRIVSELEEDKGQYDMPTSIFWASGACLFLRLPEFIQQGGFDDFFFAHMEEIDFCWKMKARGRDVMCIPQSVVYHLGGGTLTKENPHKTYLNYRNNLLLLYKNLLPCDARIVFFFRFFLDYLAACMMLLQGKPKDAKAVWKARKDFARHKHQFAAVRTENIEKTLINKHKEMYKGSIVWDFYVRRKKKFSALSLARLFQ
ncbi:MAG: glycosyltransferase family 2 protein [Paludibacteraceae bacterium]|nr:glycosyltransferase family 2 protein [Paludibacteraceae bacterium]